MFTEISFVSNKYPELWCSVYSLALPIYYCAYCCTVNFYRSWIFMQTQGALVDDRRAANNNYVPNWKIWLQPAGTVLLIYYAAAYCSFYEIYVANFMRSFHGPVRHLFRFFRGFNYTYVPMYLCESIHKSCPNQINFASTPRHNSHGLHGMLITILMYNWDVISAGEW